jgi:hypothetical protein
MNLYIHMSDWMIELKIYCVLSIAATNRVQHVYNRWKDQEVENEGGLSIIVGRKKKQLLLLLMVYETNLKKQYKEKIFVFFFKKNVLILFLFDTHQQAQMRFLVG